MKIEFKIILGLLLTFNMAFGQTQTQIDSNTRKVVLTNICNALNSYYVFADKAKIISDYIKQQNEKGKYDLINYPKELASQVAKDIRSAYNDSHIRIEYDPELEKDILKFLSSKKGAMKVSEEDIASDEKKNFYFRKIEVLPSNIGYIEFNGFANPSPSTRKTIYSALQFVSHTDALIIDLRNNFGGNGTTAFEFASYFFNTKTCKGRSFNRIENKWTDQYIENKKIITNGLVLNMPVYILTSNRTFSAAEGLAYNLQNLRNAIVIGDTTRGGAHLTRSFSLGNGFVGFIPYSRSENIVTKTDWEGTGVIPNIATEFDNSLLTAQNTILQNKLFTATNEIEKRKINYIINYNKSKYMSTVVESSAASKFIGQFAEFEVTLRENQLLFRDSNQSNINYKKMTAITPTLFQVGNDYQVEFVMEESSCNSIKMNWDDGWSEIIKRVK